MFFNPVTKLILILIYAIFISSCASPYFGYSESEWQKLDNEDKNTITAGYQNIITSRNTLRRTDEINEFTNSNVNQGRALREYQEVFSYSKKH